MKRQLAVTLLTMIWCFCGCADSKTQIPEGTDLVAYAEQAGREAEQARATGNVEAARKAADRAKAALQAAEQKAEKADKAAQTEAKELVRKVRRAARQADKAADLAEEQRSLEKKRTGWKARSYRAARGPALKLVFAGMALATRHAATHGYDALSDEQKVAVDLADILAEAPRLPDGKPDWPAVSDKLETFGDNPPQEVSLVLAVAFALLRQDGLALLEVEMIDQAAIDDPDERTLCRLLRGVVLHLNGFSRHAGQEFQLAASEQGKAGGPELEGSIHLLLALYHAEQRNWLEVDREIMTATRIWPDNLIGQVLTGEVMIAQGEYEPAAKTLEDLLGEDGLDPWIVEHIQKRAREIRDSDGEVEPLFHDSGFIIDMSYHAVAQAAAKSKSAGKLKDYMDSAKGFGAKCMKHLQKVPGLGGSRDAPAE